jgi:NADH-quinone oxidoreductase E subunit
VSRFEIADAAVQPKTFAFNEVMQAEADKHIAKYPPGRQQSAVMPLLDLAQRQEGWVTSASVAYIATMLDMAEIRVWEVVSFYTMYRTQPGGKYHVEVCTTTPCWLRGSDDVVAACKSKLGIGFGETTEDGMFTLHEVECLGACVNAPMVAIADDYYEDLDGPKTEAILDALMRGDAPTPGPQIERLTSAPAGGLTSLTSVSGDD